MRILKWLALMLSELMIIAGLVIGGYAAWQVYYTNIGANKAQSEALEKFYEDSPVINNTADPAPRQEGPPPQMATPEYGETIGVIHIPRFGSEWKHTIKHGTDLYTIIDHGHFGHYEDTAMPGDIGNFATAAHRISYGAAMKDVENLEFGDKIIIETKDAYLIYNFMAEEIVYPSGTWVIDPDPFLTDNGNIPWEQVIANHQNQKIIDENGEEVPQSDLLDRRLLTITTCHPPFVSDKRWAVWAEFEGWTNKADGLPAELMEGHI